MFTSSYLIFIFFLRFLLISTLKAFPRSSTNSQ